MTGNKLYALFGEEEEKLLGYRSGVWDNVSECKMELFDRVAARLHVKARVHINPECPLNVINMVLGEPPNDKGYSPNPGWWVTVEDEGGKVLFESPISMCIAGLGVKVG